MTTVRIEGVDPLDPRWREELRRLLDGQPDQPPGWAARLQEDLCERLVGRYGTFLRAALEDGSLAGGALVLARREAGEGRARPWLAALWVRPDLRGRGLGRRLLESVERWARERGAVELVALANPEDDTSLYILERRGFGRERIVLARGIAGAGPRATPDRRDA